MKMKQRLALTEDKEKVVPYDSRDARFLFCIPGRVIPNALAKKYGLEDGGLPGNEEAPIEIDLDDDDIDEQDLLEEWEKDPDSNNPAWVLNPDTDEWEHRVETDDGLFLNGVLQEPALPDVPGDDEKDDVEKKGEDKKEDKQGKKPEDKRILKSENKRQRGRK